MQKNQPSYETSSNFDIFDTLSSSLECHKVPRPPRKTTWQPAWKPSKRRGFAASPIDTAKPRENQRLETRHVQAPKRAFRARPHPIFTLCSFKIDVFLRVFVGTSKIRNFKIDVSCEASVNFQHMSQNATPATEFAPCRHLTQPCQCDLQKTRHTTRLKCCACHAKWRWARPKCCACHANCHASSENVAKVLRLPHKTTFDTLQNTSEFCHKVPRLPRETKQRNVGNIQKRPLLQNLP